MFLPGWRLLLEHRWRERLAAVTELSLAYHDAADRMPYCGEDSISAQSRERHRLMRRAVAARQALTDTQDALARLSAGRFGHCEQCAIMIDAARLGRNPEERYCAHCAQVPPERDAPDGPATVGQISDASGAK
jgi:RNA polymerase-binding transcription factor DksA